MVLTSSIKDRFFKKVVKHLGCWEWIGAKANFGYGILGVGSRKQGLIRAHRLSWQIHYGLIPDGLIILHDCDNPECCNPEHLRLGTHKDNHIDCVNKGRAKAPPSGMKHNRRKLSEQDMPIIKSMHLRGVSFREIGRQYGVSHSSISGIINGKFWKCCDAS